MYYRIFFAIELPESLKKILREFIEELKIELSGIRWVNPYNTHLTIRFIGDYDAESIPRMVETIEDKLKKANAGDIFFKGLGVFPNPNKLRVLWMGIRDDNKILENLRLCLDNGLNRLDISEEKKLFKPHLTLGRVKRGVKIPSEKIEEILDNYKDFSLPGIPVSSLILFRSILKPKGPEYWTLKKFDI
jgi:2'-5' RNA ligase